MIIVTGGAGFIGSNLVAKLEHHHLGPLIVCDTLGSDERWQNLKNRAIADLILPEELEFFLNDQKHKIEIIYHLGANSSTTETNADLIMSQNYKFSKKLFHWCAHNQTRFIYASSAATYGDGSQGFEDVQNGKELGKYIPLNVYGWSKHLFDRQIVMLKETKAAQPSQCVGLKFFNVYGPNEYHKKGMHSVILKLFHQISNSQVPTLFKSYHPDYKDGEQIRDFIWIDDCTDAMLWLYHHPEVNGIFNMGTGEKHTFNDLALAVFKALNKDYQIEYIKMPEEIRAKYQYFTQAKMELFRSQGYSKPFTSLEAGVKEYVQNYLLKYDPYR